jgi:diguanylate cyclase (GGDEF)-like protein/PAS domain S-box-containing protein
MARDKLETDVSSGVEELPAGPPGPLGLDATAVLGMLWDGRPLNAHAGPVLLIDRAKQVIAANAPALGIAHGLVTGANSRLYTMIDDVLSGKAGPNGLRMSDPDSEIATDLAAFVLDGGAHALLIGRDVSLDDNLRAALVESRQRYKDLVEISSDFAWETDAKGIFIFVSPGGALGYSAGELVGRKATNFVELPEGVDVDLPFTTHRPMYDAEFNFKRPDGSFADLIASALPLLDEKGAWQGVRGVCRDVTEELTRDAALARAQNRERLMAYIVRAIRDEIEPGAMLQSAAVAVARALSADGCQIMRTGSRGGFRRASTFGDPPADPIIIFDQSVEGAATREMETYRAIAHATHYHHTVNGAIELWRAAPSLPWDEEEIRLLASVASQVGIALHQVAAHERLEELSTTDQMTGLLNRRTFNERVRTRVQPEDGGAPVAGVLAFVDLDNFKLVNDRLGHQAGDDALIAMARALRAAVRLDDLVARLGGDEFALWLDGVDIGLAEGRACDLLADKAIFSPFVVDPDRPLGMSIGLAAFDPAGGETLEQLIARADAAMYGIKRDGKNAMAVAPPAGAEDASRTETKVS